MCNQCETQEAVHKGLCADCLSEDTASSEEYFGGINVDFGVDCGNADFFTERSL